jgi:hypothetical protein
VRSCSSTSRFCKKRGGYAAVHASGSSRSGSPQRHPGRHPNQSSQQAWLLARPANTQGAQTEQGATASSPRVQQPPPPPPSPTLLFSRSFSSFTCAMLS